MDWKPLSLSKHSPAQKKWKKKMTHQVMLLFPLIRPSMFELLHTHGLTSMSFGFLFLSPYLSILLFCLHQLLLICLFHQEKEHSYFSWVAPLLLQNTNKSYVRPQINRILSKFVFIPLSDCVSALEALLCSRTEKRLVKEGGREENVRAVRLGDQVFCYSWWNLRF